MCGAMRSEERREPQDVYGCPQGFFRGPQIAYGIPQEFCGGPLRSGGDPQEVCVSPQMVYCGPLDRSGGRCLLVRYPNPGHAMSTRTTARFELERSRQTQPFTIFDEVASREAQQDATVFVSDTQTNALPAPKILVALRISQQSKEPWGNHSLPDSFRACSMPVVCLLVERHKSTLALTLPSCWPAIMITPSPVLVKPSQFPCA